MEIGIFNGQPYHTDDYIFNKNVKAVWGCPHMTSPLSRNRGPGASKIDEAKSDKNDE
jgi:hypothetical protein